MSFAAVHDNLMVVLGVVRDKSFSRFIVTSHTIIIFT